MAAVKLLDFVDIQNYVLEQLKIPASDTTTLDRIKRDINIIYVNEVAPFERWPWLLKRCDIVHTKYYPAGISPAPTASVTEGSTTVTLSTVVPVGLGSQAGKTFASNSFSENYIVDTHTAGSNTIELKTPFLGETSATAAFKVWDEKVLLPTNARETVDVFHDLQSRGLVPRGPQKFNELRHRLPRSEDIMKYYSTDDYIDPSSGDPETESDRQRFFRVFPAVTKSSITLHVDYIQEVDALDLDGDEPLMAIEDRIVLAYGALRQAWIRDRDPETASLNDSLFTAKLGRMKTRTEDSLDMPRLEVDDQYIRLKRNTRRLFTSR